MASCAVVQRYTEKASRHSDRTPREHAIAERTLNAEQLAVVGAPEPRFVVIAGAGSGKTTILVERYVRHVLVEGVSPRSILTITYTNKAATEMRRRILSRLREEGAIDQAESAETGPIGTIHAFCERTLRENALAAGIDCNFEPIEGLELDNLTQEVIRAAILESTGEDRHDINEVVSLLTGSGRRPYDALERAIGEFLSKFRCGENLVADVEHLHRDIASVRAHWHGLLLNDVPPALAAACTGHRGSIDFYSELQTSANDLGIKTSWKWFKSSHFQEEERSARYAAALVRLGCAAWRRLERRMRSLQRFDFAAQEGLALGLLEGSESVRRRLREALPIVLVDEAQDMNPLQHRLLRALDPKKIMYVGDAQQSIYGFREADPQLFLNLGTPLPVYRLTTNHRSTPPILDFVADVAQASWGEEHVPMVPALSDCSPAVNIVETNGFAEPTAIADEVARVIATGVQPEEIAILVKKWKEAERIQERLKELKVPVTVERGARDFFTRLEVRDMANALRSVTDPLDDFSLLAVLRSPFVGLSLDAIVELGLRPSPLRLQLPQFAPKLEIDRERLEEFLGWFVPLEETAGRLAAWEVLSELMAKSGYLEEAAGSVRGQEAIANVRKLLALAIESPFSDAAEFAERVREVERFRHEESSASIAPVNAVRIMTVFGAKGLEFPVVAVGQNFQGFAKGPGDLEIDASSGTLAWRWKKTQPLHMLELLTEKRRRRESQEGRRLLYVALTRAQRRLLVFYEPGHKGDDASTLISQAVSGRNKIVDLRPHLKQAQ